MDNQGEIDLSKSLSRPKPSFPPPSVESEGGGGLIGWALRHSGGLITTREQMAYVLLALAALALAVSAYLFFDSGRPSPPSPDEVIWVAGPGAKYGK